MTTTIENIRTWRRTSPDYYIYMFSHALCVRIKMFPTFGGGDKRRRHSSAQSMGNALKLNLMENQTRALIHTNKTNLTLHYIVHRLLYIVYIAYISFAIYIAIRKHFFCSISASEDAKRRFAILADIRRITREREWEKKTNQDPFEPRPHSIMCCTHVYTCYRIVHANNTHTNI